MMFGLRASSLGAILAATALIGSIVPMNCYYNETKFKAMVLHDHTNDDASHMDTVSNLYCTERVETGASVSR